MHAQDRRDPAGRPAGAGDEPDGGQERDRVGLEPAEPGRLEQPEEPGLGQRLDRLGRHHAGVLGLLGPLPQHRQQFADPATTACPTFSLTGYPSDRATSGLVIAVPPRLEHVLVVKAARRRSPEPVEQPEPITEGVMNDRHGVRGIIDRARRRPGSRAAGTAWAWPMRSGSQARTRSRRSGPSWWSSPTPAGALNVLDAYCRHMGGDLTEGTIKGDQVACPFHDWRWGGDGRCARIPYAARVPPAARTRSWLTLEQNRQLFVWNDPQGNPPPEHVTIPRIEGAFSDEWSQLDLGLDPGRRRELPRGDRQRRRHGALLLHPLRVPDVLQERARGAHRLAVPEHPGAAGRRDRLELRAGDETTLRSEASYYGPSYMIDYLWHDYHGMTMESVLINCHYPGHAQLVPAAVGRDRQEAARPRRRAGRQVRRQVRQVHRPGLRAGRGDLDAQDPRRQPAAVRRGRPGLPVAPLVRAVLHRRRGHHAADGRAVRVRGGHHPGGSGMGDGGGGEPRPAGRGS